MRGLNLPDHWTLESIHMNEASDYAEAVISGHEFPDDADGIKECKIIVHVERMRFQVEAV